MAACVALLRAVNLGSDSTLPMADLRAMGQACGFDRVRTFIASGNLLFESDLDESAAKALVEAQLARRAGRPVEVFVRTATELDAIVAANPFPEANGSRHMVFFYDNPPASDLIAQCRGLRGERLWLGTRELHVEYGEGIRETKLKIPDNLLRTARNMNTVRKLADLLRT